MKFVGKVFGTVSIGVLALVLSGCATSGTRPVGPGPVGVGSTDPVNYGKATRHDRLQRQVTEERKQELLRKAEDLIQAGILYFNAQNFSRAIDNFGPAEGILKGFTREGSAVRRRYKDARKYLRASYEKHSRELLEAAKTQVQLGVRHLDLRMLNLAEEALLKAKRMDPNLSNEIDGLLRQIRVAKQRIATQSQTSERHYNSLFGPAVYPGAKYWGLILVYAYA